MDPLQTAEPKQTIPLRRAPLRPPIDKLLPILIVVLVIAAGIFSGLVASSRSKSGSQAQSAIKADDDLPAEVQESFAQTFKDQAEGTVQKNEDLEKYSQGTHILTREGGESQNAYLTSTVLDLDAYVGKKVKVFGETFGSSQVGWLMDVGKVEEVN